MKSILKYLFIIIGLTILTQVGGLIYLIYKPLGKRIDQKYPLEKVKKWTTKIGLFSILFLVTSIVIIPTIAPLFGRVTMPLFATKECPLRPANLMTCLLNRHYVKPELLSVIQDITKQINQGKTERTEIIYLDANFPFINGFPLLPHKSHDDGEKLDIAFLFKDKSSKQRSNHRLSFIGYGVCVIPEKGETNMPKICKEKGAIQYSVLKHITSQAPLEELIFDKKANKDLLIRLAKHPKVGKIFIEPHLKERLGLSGYSKIRFHGCGAVRHDDHIHLQL